METDEKIEMHADIKEKQKLMVLFGIFGLAAVLMYYNLLLRPQFSTFIARNREYISIKRRVLDAESLIRNKDNIMQQFENLREQSGLAEKKLPGQDEVSSLLGEFSDIAESSGVKILRIKPLEVIGGAYQEVAADKAYSIFPILIEARAGYHQAGTFINKLENMDYFIAIDDIDIRGRSPDPRRHDIRLRTRTYITP